MREVRRKRVKPRAGFQMRKNPGMRSRSGRATQHLLSIGMLLLREQVLPFSVCGFRTAAPRLPWIETLRVFGLSTLFVGVRVFPGFGKRV